MKKAEVKPEVREILDMTCLYYSKRSENKNKFYIATIEKDKHGIFVVFKYGRLGNTKPSKRGYPCSSLGQAQKKYFDKIREQKNQGYLETDLEVIMQSDGSFME
jgi:WGR domain.